MTRQTAEVLEEIAILLRQYVEHTAEMSKRAQERLAKLTPPKMDLRRDIKEIERKSDAVAQRRSAEESAFRRRLLALLESHNRMLAQVLRAQAKHRKAKAKRRAQ